MAEYPHTPWVKPLETRLPGELRLAPDVVGLWHYDEGQGMTLHDASFNGNDGVLQAAPADPSWVAGVMGYGLDFDGDDYVLLPLLCNTPEGTVEVWFNPRTYPPGVYSTMFSVGRLGNPAVNGLFIFVQAQHLRAWLWTGFGWQFIGVLWVVTLNAWQHAAFTWGPAGMRLYHNAGVPTTNAHVGAPQVAGNSYLGWHHEVVTDYFDGLEDELLVSNRQRSHSEIIADFNHSPLSRLVS